MNAEGNTFRWTNLVPDDSNTFLFTNFLPGSHTAMRIRTDSDEDMSTHGIALPSYLRITVKVPLHVQVVDSSPTASIKTDSECESDSCTLESGSKRSETKKKKKTKDKKKKKHKHKKCKEQKLDGVQRADSQKSIFAGKDQLHSDSYKEEKKKKSKKKKRHATTVTLNTSSTPLEGNVTTMAENDMYHSPHPSEKVRLLHQSSLQDFHQSPNPSAIEPLTYEYTTTRENASVPFDFSDGKGESAMMLSPPTSKQTSPSKVKSIRSEVDIDTFKRTKRRSKSTQPATRTCDSILRHSPQRGSRRETSGKVKTHRKKSKSTPSTRTDRLKLLDEIPNDEGTKSRHQSRNEHQTKQGNIQDENLLKQSILHSSSIQKNDRFIAPLSYELDMATCNDLEHKPRQKLDGLVMQGTADYPYHPHHIRDTSMTVRQSRNAMGTIDVEKSGTETVANQNSMSYAVNMTPDQVGRHTKLNQNLLQHMTSHDTKNTDDDSFAKLTEVSVAKLSTLSLDEQLQDPKPMYANEVKMTVKSGNTNKKLSLRRKMTLACCWKPRDFFE